MKTIIGKFAKDVESSLNYLVKIAVVLFVLFVSSLIGLIYLLNN